MSYGKRFVFIYKYKLLFQKAKLLIAPCNHCCRGSSTVVKIRQALDFMRNQTLEVPFIAFYRKEYVQPELSINDLWKVYKYDAKVRVIY